jgi:hypothetical protein
MKRIWFRAPGVCLALCAATVAYAAGGAGAISFSQPIYSVARDAGVSFITLNRTGGSTGAASATYATLDSSALAGSDYTATQGTVSWADGDWAPKAFIVPISPAGAGGAFTVNLMSASGAAFGNSIGATVLIGPPANMVPTAAGAIQFAEPVYSVAPGATSVVATLDRVQGSSGSALVTYTTVSGTAQAGSAFVPSSGSYLWADGESSPISFSIPMFPNAAAGQTFSLAISSASGAAFGDPIEATISIRQSAAGAVSLSWAAPTQNTDGSVLTDLAGYYLYYGTGGGQATQVMQLSDPNQTSIELSGLSQGTWYFAAMAYNSSGATSGMSSVVSATIE